MLVSVFNHIPERFILIGEQDNEESVWKETVKEYYNRLKEDRLIEWAFISGGINSEEDMVRLFTNENACSFFCLDKKNDNSLVGACQLTNQIGQA